MTKKIAVLVRDRQGEALRMSLGLTLLDDHVDVCVLSGKLEETESDTLDLELMKELKMKIYSNHKGNEDIEYFSTEEIAEILLQYDHIIPY